MRVHASLLLMLAIVSSSAIACAPQSAAYPQKPVTLIVPYPPGGVSDLTARPLVQEASVAFSQPITIVNRGGGAGTVGFAEAIQAKPDGYTIGWGSAGISAIQPHLTDLPYKTPDDYRPIISIGDSPEILAVRSDAPWKTVKEMLEYAKANPGKVRVAIPGVGSIQEMLFLSLKDLSGTDMIGVPFSGGGEAIPALLGGHTEAIVVAPAPMLSQIKAGKAKVLATFSEKRLSSFPDAPTMREAGYDVAKDEYLFVAAPKATPDKIAQAVHDAFKKAMDSAAFKKFADENGLIVKYEGPTELKQRLQNDYTYFGELIKKNGQEKSK